MEETRNRVKPLVKFLDILAYASMIILFIAGVIKASDEKSGSWLLIYVAIGAASSIFLFVFSTVVDLLFKIYENTSKSE